MDIVYKILILLDYKTAQPHMYGFLHILFLCLVIITTILLYKKYKNSTYEETDKVLKICSIIMITFEIYKQINFSFKYGDFGHYWSYEWYAFPYQFCSTPMYVGLLGSLTKNMNLKKSCYAFLATYGLVAGVLVMLYPSTIMIPTLGISIQSLTHHGLMVVMGLFVLLTKKVEFNFKTIIDALKMFIILTLLALVIDIVTYYLKIDNGLEMFYISPYHVSTLPVFESIYQAVPYPIFLIIYFVLFTIGCGITILISKLISRR